MQALEHIYVNGVLLSESVDYEISNSQVVFNIAPEHNSDVHISTALHGGGAHIVRYHGDGYMTQFPLDNSFKNAMRHNSLLANIKKYKDNPAVADLVERLEAVMTLLDDETRQS
jgi:hypothetical protein